MRRPIVITFFVAFVVYFFAAPNTADAQTKARAALKYSTHIEAIGIGVGADLPVADLIRVGGDFNFFLPGDEGGVDITAWTLNVNGFYELLVNDSMTVHGVAGINYLNWSYDSGYCDSFGGAFGISCDDTFTDVGLNLGGLAEFGTGGLGFFASAIISGLGGDSSGLEVGGGVTVEL